MYLIGQVCSNVDRGPLARKRDVAFIYHTNKMNDLKQQVGHPLSSIILSDYMLLLSIPSLNR
jgi:hypothetical protein